MNRSTVTKYPYELLLKPADELPEDVNPELREVIKSFEKKFHLIEYI